jgi:hypothetical protein
MGRVEMGRVEETVQRRCVEVVVLKGCVVEEGQKRLYRVAKGSRRISRRR